MPEVMLAIGARRVMWHRRFSHGATVAIVAWTLAGATTAWGAGGGPANELRVLAAASLADGFGEIAAAFEKAHPGLAVRLDLAGSQQLALQIQEGARADVFASADQAWMDHLRERSWIDGEPAVFAHNVLVVVVPRANPARIGRLQDLARRAVKVVIGIEAVPVGRYGRQALHKLSATPGFGSDFAARVLANVVSEEENTKSVLGKVRLGEADAGLVYASDITPAFARLVRVFQIPPAANVVARYPITVLRGAPLPGAARAFVAFVLSAEGQRILERHGFLRA